MKTIWQWYHSAGLTGFIKVMFLILVPLLALAGIYRGFFQEDLPVTYHIGRVDQRFALSREDVDDAVSRAISPWETAAGRQLFKEEVNGSIEINFLYDYRQETGEKLKAITGHIDTTKGSYDALKAHLEKAGAEFKQKQAALAADVDAYNARVASYQAQSNASAQRGSAPGEIHQRLLEEKADLEKVRTDLQARQDDLNTTADALNDMVATINEIAARLNLDVVTYNNVGNQLGSRYSEGLYESRNGAQTITIFHFADKDRLVRVLAHEFGHALGLQHNNNPQSLMYPLNQAVDLTLSPEDVRALRQRCGSN